MKKIFNLNWLSGVLIGAMVFMVFACAGKNPYIINLMPAPGVYSDGYVDPFADHNPIENIPYTGVLFATDRAPTDEKGKFYQEKRGNLLRLGVGQLEIGKKKHHLGGSPSNIPVKKPLWNVSSENNKC